MAAIIVRPETPDDYPAVRAALTLAFPDEDVAGLTETLRTVPGYTPQLSLAAIADGAVVGHILFTAIHIETPAGDAAALMLGPLGVVPNRQNQGIGTRLVREGLEACRKLGHRIVMVIGHPGYYPRFGFVQASMRGITMKYGELDEAKMVMELVPGSLDGVNGPVRFPSALDEA